MKLLIIGNGSIGNDSNREYYVNNHTGKFLTELQKEHCVRFIQSISAYNANNDLQNFNIANTDVKFWGISNTKNPFAILKLAYDVLQSDFVYLFFPGTLSRIAAFLSILLRKKFGLYIRGQYFNQNSLDRAILKNAKTILTVSPHFKEELNSYCKHVGIIKPMISIKKEDLKTDRDYSIPAKWNLLFVGRVEYRKGINELLQIADILKSNGLDFELNIVGGGDQYTNLNEILIKQKKDDYIKLHGQIADKARLKTLYDEAHAFIFTSHDEGFPRVLYEAMASGLPIFTTFVGGIPGRMKDQKNGIEIPVKNAAAAAAIIIEKIKNTDLLKTIGINGQQTLLEIIDGKYLPHEKLLLKYLKND